MKSPQNQKIIQIDITNACVHKCSNCTRFCGHHQTPYMMDFETFKSAVDSLVDFPGMVGIMGGEPTLHPEFDRFVEYYASRIGSKSRSHRGVDPIVDFSDYRNMELSQVQGARGLWSSLGKGYYRHFELIQEVFDYQCLNDHVNPGLHQALLIARKDLGISDEEWIPLRDQCWIQNLWSSTITPKGAFFCEVAGALDMLFDGPGGWDVNSQWWKRTPEQFGDQLKWCELCGAALQVPRRQANEEIDDVSPTLLKKLEAIRSPQLKQKRVAVLEPTTYTPEAYACEPSMEWYLPAGDNQQRVAGTNRSLYPQDITAVVYGVCPPDTARHFDRVIETTRATDLGTLPLTDWVVVLDGATSLADDFGKKIRNWILNPGCIYFQPRVPAGSFVKNEINQEALFYLFNVRARALKQGFHGAVLQEQWALHKQIDLSAWLLKSKGPDESEIQGDFLARHMVSTWQALCSIRDTVYLFGAGQHTLWLLALIHHFKLPDPAAVLDDFAADRELSGVQVLNPASIEPPGIVMISANTAAVSSALKGRCAQLWGDQVPVVDPYAAFPALTYRKSIPSK